jgi:hypothetical protein
MLGPHATVQCLGASKFAVAAAHRILAQSVDDDILLVAFALLKLHEEYLAHAPVLKLLAQLQNLISAPRQANPVDPPETSRRALAHRTEDAEPLATEWEVMIQHALDRLKSDDDLAIWDLAKNVAKSVSEHQDNHTALSDDQIRLALGLAVQIIQQGREDQATALNRKPEGTPPGWPLG